MKDRVVSPENFADVSMDLLLEMTNEAIADFEGELEASEDEGEPEPSQDP